MGKRIPVETACDERAFVMYGRACNRSSTVSGAVRDECVGGPPNNAIGRRSPRPWGDGNRRWVSYCGAKGDSRVREGMSCRPSGGSVTTERSGQVRHSCGFQRVVLARALGFEGSRPDVGRVIEDCISFDASGRMLYPSTWPVWQRLLAKSLIPYCLDHTTTFPGLPQSLSQESCCGFKQLPCRLREVSSPPLDSSLDRDGS